MKHSRHDYQHIQEFISSKVTKMIASILDKHNVSDELKNELLVTLDSLETHKIPMDEPVFLFRSNDVLSVQVLEYYGTLLYKTATPQSDIYKNLMKTIWDFKEYQRKAGCKIPDYTAPKIDTDEVRG